MKSTGLTPMPVEGLETYANPCDLLRDIYAYVEYMQEREVKRMYRSNQLSKADSGRLAKLLSNAEASEQVKQDGSAAWIDFVDVLALVLGLVSYNTQGEYSSYSSQEPSFPNNYVIANQARLKTFQEMAPTGQEARLLQTLIDQMPDELYSPSPLGLLSAFPGWSRTTLETARARRILLDVLQTCESGTWYATQSLVQYLKERQRDFLIPLKVPRDRWGNPQSRYGYFYESKGSYMGNPHPIPDDAPDGFERVEGRYVERFLEGLPLILRYVEVAYTPGPYQGNYPEMHRLQAFRTTPRFQRAMRGEISPPRVTVQPNFEVVVESEVYPAQVLSQLRPLTEAVSENPSGSVSVTILRLKKERVAVALIQEQDLDVNRLLADLSGRALPQNVAVELDEWSGHAEMFTLYEGFGLLESVDGLPQAEGYTVEQIGPQLRLVRSPEQLFEQLEKAQLAPLAVKHPADSLAQLPREAHTIFRKKTGATQRSKYQGPPRPVTLLSTTTIELRFPTDEIFAIFRSALLETRCPIEANPTELTIRYNRQYQTQVDEITRSLEGRYDIRIQEV